MRKMKKTLLVVLLSVVGAIGAAAQTEIASLNEIPDNSSGSFVLTADCAAPSASITGFTGTLDGGFHKVTDATQALFATLNGATVKNVILDDVNISVTTANADVGAIANTASGDARVYNCGTAINNVGNINTYNYFIYDDGITYANNATGASGVVDKSLLTRFDMYRGILNSHRDLCAMYINNSQTITDDQRHDIALWLYDPAQRETVPYLQLEPCVVGTRRTLDRVIPTTTEERKGRKLRDIACTFVINGRSYTATLPTTDMDVDGEIREVFGGSNTLGYIRSQAKVDVADVPYDDPVIDLVAFTRIGRIFGGGYGETAAVHGDTHVYVNPIKGAFAGKTTSPLYVLDGADNRVLLSEAATLPYGLTKDGIGTVDQNHHLTDPGSDEEVAVTVTGDVFGGGNRAIVSGDAKVVIGSEE